MHTIIWLEEDEGNGMEWVFGWKWKQTKGTQLHHISTVVTAVNTKKTQSICIYIKEPEDKHRFCLPICSENTKTSKQTI